MSRFTAVQGMAPGVVLAGQVGWTIRLVASCLVGYARWNDRQNDRRHPGSWQTSLSRLRATAGTERLIHGPVEPGGEVARVGGKGGERRLRCPLQTAGEPLDRGDNMAQANRHAGRRQRRQTNRNLDLPT